MQKLRVELDYSLSLPLYFWFCSWPVFHGAHHGFLCSVTHFRQAGWPTEEKCGDAGFGWWLNTDHLPSTHQGNVTMHTVGKCCCRNLTAQISFPWKQSKSFVSVTWSHTCDLVMWSVPEAFTTLCPFSVSSSMGHWCLWWVCQGCSISWRTPSSPECLNPWLSVCTAYNKEPRKQGF